MAERLRFGIIGCGVIGATHARAIQALAEHAELVAVADSVPDRAQRFASEYGAEPYTDYRQLLARRDIDVVNICLPSGMHAAVAIEAFAAGKHVVVEKPFDITLEAMDRCLEAQRRAGRKLAVIFQNRFLPAVQVVKEAAASGQFGRLTYATAEVPWWRSQGYYDSGDWRGTWALDGGGCLMNQGIHTIDLMQWIMGPVVEVQAYTATLAHERIEVEDVAVAAVRFANGALGTIAGTTALYPGLSTRLTVGGQRGSAVVEGSRLAWFHVQKEGEEADAYGGVRDGNQAEAALAAYRAAAPAVAGVDPRVPGGEGHVWQLLDMIQAIREDREPAVNGEEGRRAVAVILAIYESARTGRPVRVAQ